MSYNHSINDVMNLAAKKVGIPEWKASVWKAASGGSIVEGCVPDGVYAHGPRKGRPRFSKPKPGTEHTVIVANAELDNAAAEYEAAEHKCWECKGSGQVFSGWSKESGMRHKTCGRCSGTAISRSRVRTPSILGASEGLGTCAGVPAESSQDEGEMTTPTPPAQDGERELT